MKKQAVREKTSGLAGNRIRGRRLALGLAQGELARRVGISPAYLNLIEHNKRRIGGKLLLDLAQQLAVEPAELSENAAAALVARLAEAQAQHPDAGAEPPEELAARFPGWARLVASQQRRMERLEHSLAILTDRLSHDPFLSASLHEVLSTTASIRSTASILAGAKKVEPEWQARFQRNLLEDAKRLAEGAGGLAAYLDGAPDAQTAVRGPLDELEAWLEAQEYHLPEIEKGRALPAMPGVEPDVEHDVVPGGVVEDYIARYRRDAQALPLEQFAAAWAGCNDPFRLAAQFETGVARILRRIATLPREYLPPQGIGLLCCDASGVITFRRPVQGFDLPQFGAGCPLWPLYQALLQPHVPIRVLVEHGGRDHARFLVHAVAEISPVAGHGAGSGMVAQAVMLIQPHDSASDAPALRVGTSCRICPRKGCGARREASILSRDDERG